MNLTSVCYSNKFYLNVFSDSPDKIEDKSRETADSRTSNIQNSGRRGSLQLWQFLVALLDAPDASAGCIAWTGRGMEFKLIEPEEVSKFINEKYISALQVPFRNSLECAVTCAATLCLF